MTSVTELPAAVERLLLDVVADGFTVYCCGSRTAPTALAASYDWDHCIDQITIRELGPGHRGAGPEAGPGGCVRTRVRHVGL
ncbi:MAG: hypothetical protein DLM61_25700 [Pseudonocardiales bacterium]|nr:MAG: hypothetical protein DLM61_25700 [Pseudonocardiales bacterium]